MGVHPDKERFVSLAEDHGEHRRAFLSEFTRSP